MSSDMELKEIAAAILEDYLADPMEFSNVYESEEAGELSEEEQRKVYDYICAARFPSFVLGGLEWADEDD